MGEAESLVLLNALQAKKFDILQGHIDSAKVNVVEKLEWSELSEILGGTVSTEVLMERSK